ncbi:MAG: hypothetical protein P1U70_28100, partial [Saprospiraceae bacterium]|nr:hypothetical protein [Saprospiraceae bacterium]
QRPEAYRLAGGGSPLGVRGENGGFVNRLDKLVLNWFFEVKLLIVSLSIVPFLYFVSNSKFGLLVVQDHQIIRNYQMMKQASLSDNFKLSDKLI